MGKRIFFSVFAVGAVTASALLPSSATHRDIRTVVVLNHAPSGERAFEGLRQGLAALGWRDEEAIRFVKPPVQPDAALLRAQAWELIDSRTALAVALSTPAAMAAREVAAVHGVPLLLAPVSDPVATGLVSGTVHPGQQVTGVGFAAQEPRRMEILKRLAPGVRRIWVPHDSTDPSPTATLARLQATAAKLDVTLVPADIRSPAQLHAVLDSLPRDIDAIFVPPDAMLASNVRAIAAAGASRGLPVTVPHRDGVALGALFSYGFDLNALGRQAARLADQILSGTPAEDLPIETADMSMTINLAVADRLNLVVPEDLLRHADIVGQAGE